MSIFDDFNRIAFERASVKYNRCQYDQMSTDDWVALVEGYRKDAELGEENARMVDELSARIELLEAELDEIKFPND